MKKLKKIKKNKKIFIFIILCSFLLCSCQKHEEISGFSMDAPYSIKIVGLPDEKKEEIKNLLNKSDSIFDAYEDSYLYTLNTQKKLTRTTENSDLFEAVRKSLEFSDEFFDISVRPYTKLWNFSAENPVPPSEDELMKAKESVGYENIIYSENEIVLKNNAEIELGAVAKGYICDKVYDIADGYEGIFDIGGTIKSSVENPVSIGIRNPEGGVLCSFNIAKGESVSTSGSYERNFSYNGKFYHHIINPKTGMSVNSDLMSVTVISDSALKSDILSTKLFISGIETDTIPENVTVIFVDKNKKITQKGNPIELKINK